MCIFRVRGIGSSAWVELRAGQVVLATTGGRSLPQSAWPIGHLPIWERPSGRDAEGTALAAPIAAGTPLPQFAWPIAYLLMWERPSGRDAEATALATPIAAGTPLPHREQTLAPTLIAMAAGLRWSSRADARSHTDRNGGRVALVVAGRRPLPPSGGLCRWRVG